MTDEQMRDLVKECGLDWQRGYMPLFDDDPTNRYAVLIEAVEALERDACAKVCQSLPSFGPDDGSAEWYGLGVLACADAIRARATG
jgi:hypothetical protein